ncbi:hypothetical protein [Micromonospora musae]|uniref:hypothetical protein n=1 Tax=Micromonospora musae TaxID=1894970 RepID=UPI0033CDFFF0
MPTDGRGATVMVGESSGSGRSSGGVESSGSSVGSEVGSVGGTEIVPDGDGLAVGSSVGSSLGDVLGLGDAVGDGGREGPGGLLGVGRGAGGGGRGRRVGSAPVPVSSDPYRGGSDRSGPPSGKPADQPLTADGLEVGRADGWPDVGRGTTTGPTEGVGMNGVLLSGSAVLPTVAEPVLIAARIGIEAVPASSATVKR